MDLDGCLEGVVVTPERERLHFEGGIPGLGRHFGIRRRA
jgi:hypothetical protein